MNICLCGAEAGYPHDQDCPYPLYKTTHEKATREQYQVWNQARKARRRLRLEHARADANRKQIDKRR